MSDGKFGLRLLLSVLAAWAAALAVLFIGFQLPIWVWTSLDGIMIFVWFLLCMVAGAYALIHVMRLTEPKRK